MAADSTSSKLVWSHQRSYHDCRTHTQLRSDLDVAKHEDEVLVGLKLDKSKCFDRLIPAMAGVLMLAFGLPRGVVHFFLQIYANLRRRARVDIPCRHDGLQWGRAGMFVIPHSHQLVHGCVVDFLQSHSHDYHQGFHR